MGSHVRKTTLIQQQSIKTDDITVYDQLVNQQKVSLEPCS